jgi:hypothetical protein
MRSKENKVGNNMFHLLKRKDKGIFAQGIYYFATGVWPFVHRRSFLKVTGPKNDLWLVHAVGSLVTASGVVLLRSAAKKRVTPEIQMLAAGSALGLAAVELHSIWRGAIRKIYLADTLLELGFALFNMRNIKLRFRR